MAPKDIENSAAYGLQWTRIKLESFCHILFVGFNWV